jgi:hypothetical protein
VGFPFEYLLRVDFSLPGSSGVFYTFSLTRALADYMLWLGVAFSVIGFFGLIISRRSLKDSQMIPLSDRETR